MERRVVVEGYVAGGSVKVEGGDDEMGDANKVVTFCDEREGGNKFTRGSVVSLMVEDYARLMGRRWWFGCGRHGMLEGKEVLDGILKTITAKTDISYTASKVCYHE